uniref:Uncharacterized protein n=1 Tax=Helianthus annuus TaxID=4232 RepID=A0A251VIB8_HELAN
MQIQVQLSTPSSKALATLEPFLGLQATSSTSKIRVALHIMKSINNNIVNCANNQN